MDTRLPEDLYGARLESVSELLYEPPDKSGPPMREAIALRLGDRILILQALVDTSELQVSLGRLEAREADYRIRDASDDTHFRAAMGKCLRNWWVACNDAGYTDAFMVAFDPRGGLCFVAMNNEVSVLAVFGEQWS